MRAISHAQTVISWQENLMHDEVPPPWMWPFDDEITEWFEEVRRIRDDRYGGHDRREDASDMMENDLAKDLVRR